MGALRDATHAQLSLARGVAIEMIKAYLDALTTEGK
jgi:hypothetical protein